MILQESKYTPLKTMIIIRNSQQLQLGDDDVVVYQIEDFREMNHACANDNALGIRGGKPVM